MAICKVAIYSNVNQTPTNLTKMQTNLIYMLHLEISILSIYYSNIIQILL